MKLGEAIPKYQAYRNQLFQEKNVLELAYHEKNTQFEKYNTVLEQLREQWCNAVNAESAKALSDPETGMAATLGKIMTTVARMCAGDKVPYTDEKKVMEYDNEMYLSAKQAQMAMAALKKRQKEYDSLWDEEGGEYDTTDAADNAAAPSGLPAIPASGEAAALEEATVAAEAPAPVAEAPTPAL